MVIFHSYVSLPEGIALNSINLPLQLSILLVSRSVKLGLAKLVRPSERSSAGARRANWETNEGRIIGIYGGFTVGL
jgi:hypothetical protein